MYPLYQAIRKSTVAEMVKFREGGEGFEGSSLLQW